MSDQARRAAQLLELLNVPFSFRHRPSPVPSDLRPAWRIATLLLIISRCRNSQATWKQLHLLNWAIRSPSSRKMILDILRGATTPDKAIVRYEPGLNRAIDLAVGEGFVIWDKGRLLSLTDSGESIVAAINENDSLLAEEKVFLDSISVKISQAWVERLLEAHLR